MRMDMWGCPPLACMEYAAVVIALEIPAAPVVVEDDKILSAPPPKVKACRTRSSNGPSSSDKDIIPTIRGGVLANARDKIDVTPPILLASPPSPTTPTLVRRAFHTFFRFTSLRCFAALARLALADCRLVSGVDFIPFLPLSPLGSWILPPWLRDTLRLEALERLFFLFCCLSFPARWEWFGMIVDVDCLPVT